MLTPKTLKLVKKQGRGCVDKKRLYVVYNKSGGNSVCSRPARCEQWRQQQQHKSRCEQDGDSNKNIRTDWLGIGLNASIPEV